MGEWNQLPKVVNFNDPLAVKSYEKQLLIIIQHNLNHQIRTQPTLESENTEIFNFYKKELKRINEIIGEESESTYKSRLTEEEKYIENRLDICNLGIKICQLGEKYKNEGFSSEKKKEKFEKLKEKFYNSKNEMIPMMSNIYNEPFGRAVNFSTLNSKKFESISELNKSGKIEKEKLDIESEMLEIDIYFSESNEMLMKKQYVIDFYINEYDLELSTKKIIESLIKFCMEKAMGISFNENKKKESSFYKERNIREKYKYKELINDLTYEEQRKDFKLDVFIIEELFKIIPQFFIQKEDIFNFYREYEIKLTPLISDNIKDFIEFCICGEAEFFLWQTKFLRKNKKRIKKKKKINPLLEID